MTLNINERKNKTGTLKIIAIASMVIDHIGFIFFPEILTYRIIGRLALPVFAYGVSEGYHYTSNLEKYVTRITIFAIFAQIPFILLFDTIKLNILFTLALSLLFIYFIDKRRYVFAIAIIFLVILFPVDYGLYGILTAFIFYYFKKQKLFLIGAQTLITVIYVIITGYYFQIFALIGIFLVLYFPKHKFNFYLNKYFFYWFYPLQLIILYIIKLIYG